MGKYAQLVMGPAGSGKVCSKEDIFLTHNTSIIILKPLQQLLFLKKSTYCKTIQLHCSNIGRPVHCFNLDPAAEDIGYTPSVGMLYTDHTDAKT
jgi:hypothetical protein